MTTFAIRLRAMAIGAAVAAGLSCGGGVTTPPRTPARSPAELSPETVMTTLIYQRPSVYQSDSPPQSFMLIRDYPTSSQAERVLGSWNVDRQTLSAPVTVPLKSENLVYVRDDAVPAESDTPIDASHVGRLHQLTCPASVPPQHACYLLQILH